MSRIAARFIYLKYRHMEILKIMAVTNELKMKTVFSKRKKKAAFNELFVTIMLMGSQHL